MLGALWQRPFKKPWSAQREGSDCHLARPHRHHDLYSTRTLALPTAVFAQGSVMSSVPNLTKLSHNGIMAILSGRCKQLKEAGHPTMALRLDVTEIKAKHKPTPAPSIPSPNEPSLSTSAPRPDDAKAKCKRAPTPAAAPPIVPPKDLDLSWPSKHFAPARTLSEYVIPSRPRPQQPVPVPTSTSTPYGLASKRDCSETGPAPTFLGLPARAPSAKLLTLVRQYLDWRSITSKQMLGEEFVTHLIKCVLSRRASLRARRARMKETLPRHPPPSVLRPHRRHPRPSPPRSHPRVASHRRRQHSRTSRAKASQYPEASRHHQQPARICDAARHQ